MGHLEEIVRKVKITTKPVKLDLQIVTTVPITFEKVSEVTVTIKVPSLEEILNRFSGKEW